jgi:hypothetical protein
MVHKYLFKSESTQSYSIEIWNSDSFLFLEHATSPNLGSNIIKKGILNSCGLICRLATLYTQYAIKPASHLLCKSLHKFIAILVTVWKIHHVRDIKFYQKELYHYQFLLLFSNKWSQVIFLLLFRNKSMWQIVFQISNGFWVFQFLVLLLETTITSSFQSKDVFL